MTDPTRRIPIKALVCVAFTIAGSLVAWRYADARTRGREAVSFIDNSSGAEDLLVTRADRTAELTHGALGLEATNARAPFAIPFEDARKLFPIDGERLVYDPYTYFRYGGGRREDLTWAEHPSGHYFLKTSREGFREDFDTLPEQRDFLAIVAGDSQTDGLCGNSESYPNRTEAALATLHPSRTIEVLNAGVAGYSFYNYRGTLEKHVGLRPDVFVMAFYSGNDFKDLTVPCHYFQRTEAPRGQPEYVKLLRAAISSLGFSRVMALNPIVYFKHEPKEAALAESAAIAVCDDVRRSCREHGIELLVIHIPPAFRPGGPLPAGYEEVRSALELSDEDLGTDDRMANDLIAKLQEWKVDVLDLRDHFPEDIASYYCSDMHLNVKGHAFVAELLAPKLEALLANRKRSNHASHLR